jgi:type I restriction enzyme, S subunit
VVNVVEREQVREKLPKGWKWTTLSNICDFRNGINFTSSQKGKGLLTIDVFNMYSDSVYVSMDKLYRVDITSKDVYLLEPNDILFVRSSVKQEGVGWATLFPGYHEPVSFCGFIIRARLIDKNVDPQFLIYYLRSASIRSWIILRSSTGTITNINQENLQTLTIPLPPLLEQKRIVGILSDRLSTIDKARAATEAQLKAAKALPAAYLRQVFDSLEAQKTINLEAVCEAIVDCEHKTALTQVQGIPMIRTANIRDGKLDVDNARRVSEEIYKEWTARIKPKPNDLILAREAPVGEVGIIPLDCRVCLGQRTVLIRPISQKILSMYLLYILLTPKVRDKMHSLSEGALVPHLNVADIRGFLIPIPPSIDQQKYIVDALDKKMLEATRLQKFLQSQLSTINKLPAALLRQAFNGEL